MGYKHALNYYKSKTIIMPHETRVKYLFESPL